MDTYRVRETATSAALLYRRLRSLFTEAERARVYGSRDPVCRFDLNEREAIYRLFGRKYDSLGSLLDRITGESGDGDPVDTYVMVLCARQSLRYADLAGVLRVDHLWVSFPVRVSSPHHSWAAPPVYPAQAPPWPVPDVRTLAAAWMPAVVFRPVYRQSAHHADLAEMRCAPFPFQREQSALLRLVVGSICNPQSDR